MSFIMLGAPIQVSNTVGYFLPGNLGGFYGQAQMAFGEQLSNAAVKKAGNYAGLRGGYRSGPLNVSLATGELKGATAPADVRANNLGVSYDFGMVKPMLLWVQEKTDTAKITVVQLGATAPAGQRRAARLRWPLRHGQQQRRLEQVGRRLRLQLLQAHPALRCLCAPEQQGRLGALHRRAGPGRAGHHAGRKLHRLRNRHPPQLLSGVPGERRRRSTLGARSVAPPRFFRAMEFFAFVALLAFGWHLLKAFEQKKRIVLLGSHLAHFQIEKLMEHLTEGYLRALGENDAARREQIWALLQGTEQKLSEQFQQFASDFARADASAARASRWPLAVPFAARLFPRAAFDVRKAFQIHARGIAAAAQETPGQSAKGKAYTMSAELFLMQHTCHWFCKSRAVASARMLARHKTTHAQLVAGVAPATRRAYLQLIGVEI